MGASDLKISSAGTRALPLSVLPKEGLTLARFTGLDESGAFLVELTEASEPIRALSTIALSSDDADANVLVAFANANVQHPVIIGRLQERASPDSPTVKLDGERLVVRADRTIELRCGEASIVLTRSGKILIRGNYVLTRSRGANKIKGAFVDIN